MRLSSGMLAVLSVFDNSFSNTKLSLAFAGRNGFIVEEFIYDGDVLTEIKITRSKAKPDSQTEEHKFVYENHKLIQIERICQNGYRELKYTTKKPNFNKIKEDTYKSTIRPRCVRTNRDERVQTNGRLFYKINLRRMHTTTHGGVSRRLHSELKTVYKSVLEPPFQAQISGVSNPYTKNYFNTC